MACIPTQLSIGYYDRLNKAAGGVNNSAKPSKPMTYSLTLIHRGEHQYIHPGGREK
jgi:hypothetical protein